VCDVCGKSLMSHNKYGVCSRWNQPECLAENTKRRADANYQRTRDRVSEYGRRRRQASRHDDLTYLIYSPGLNLHKIGHTVNMAENTKSLRRGCPDIELVTTFPKGIELERWLHRHFKARRVAGEWFSGLTEDLVRSAVAEFESTPLLVAA
jgi:Meiotically up-regulated gene 113